VLGALLSRHRLQRGNARFALFQQHRGGLDAAALGSELDQGHIQLLICCAGLDAQGHRLGHQVLLALGRDVVLRLG
jgi:hypothetical protein